MKCYTEYQVVDIDTGEVLRKIKKILFDKKKYREVKREINYELKTYQNEQYSIKTITVAVREHEQLTIF